MAKKKLKPFVPQARVRAYTSSGVHDQHIHVNMYDYDVIDSGAFSEMMKALKSSLMVTFECQIEQFKEGIEKVAESFNQFGFDLSSYEPFDEQLTEDEILHAKAVMDMHKMTPEQAQETADQINAILKGDDS